MTRGVRETLVGIFVIIGVIVFIVLYTWLSGRISLRNTYDINVRFEDVEGLRVGDPVLVFGIEKGQVKSLHIKRDHVLVVLAMHRDILGKIGFAIQKTDSDKRQSKITGRF